MADAGIAPAPVHVSFTEAEAVAALRRYNHLFTAAERAAHASFFNSAFFWRGALLVGYLAGLLAAARYDDPDLLHVVERTAPGILVLLLGSVLSRRAASRHALMRARFIYRSGSVHLGTCDMTAAVDGLRLRGKGLECAYAWELFSGIDRSGGMLGLLMGPTRPVWIPERCFDGDAHRDDFIRFVRTKIIPRPGMAGARPS